MSHEEDIAHLKETLEIVKQVRRFMLENLYPDPHSRRLAELNLEIAESRARAEVDREVHRKRMEHIKLTLSEISVKLDRLLARRAAQE